MVSKIGFKCLEVIVDVTRRCNFGEHPCIPPYTSIAVGTLQSQIGAPTAYCEPSEALVHLAKLFRLALWNLCIHWRMDVPHTCCHFSPGILSSLKCYCFSHARDLPANSCSSSTSKFFQYLVALWVVLARHFHGSGVTVAAGYDTYEPGLSIPNMYGR